MGFPDPDVALDQIQAMQRAREAYGEPPDDELREAVLEQARDRGLNADFVRVLDVEDDPVMIWVLEIVTPRGTIELRRNPLVSWLDYLANDPECKPLDLVPPRVLRRCPNT